MEGLDQIREHILCLQRIDVGRLSDDELVESMREFHELESLLAAQRNRFVDQADNRKVWRTDGSKACWAWLARTCNASPTTAKSVVGLARHLRSAPATKTAFEQGELDRDRAIELSRRAASARKQIADHFPGAEEELLRHAKTLPFDSFCRALRYWESLVDEDGEEDQAANDHLSRNLHASEILRGMVRIDGTLDAVGGTTFMTELARLEREMFQSDWADAKAIHGDQTRPEHVARTPAQRRADALVEMARRSAGFEVRQNPDGEPRPLFVVHMGEGTVTRLCELATGTVIAPGLLVPHLDKADIERIIYGPNKRVIELSKRARFFTGGLRRAIELRDLRCTHPGCDEPAENCHADHIKPSSQGGETTQENGRIRCDTHNWWAWNHEQRHSSSYDNPDGPDPPDTS